ncbi:MAG TPA: hypothetical protein VG871_11375, partial [Vicinamibacterales bacterium]|nr:hypothetical protein [Vicinamibacterales bacterium]
MTVTPAQPDFSAAVTEPGQPDHDGVRVWLQAMAFGQLSGEWSYLADPLTQRNAAGAGRVGYYRLLAPSELPDKAQRFLGEQRGGEDWSPLPAEIAGVAVMQNQLATKNTLAAYPYPRGEAGPLPDDAHSRLLFVVGRDLPFDGPHVLRNVAWDAEPGLKAYTVMAVSGDPDLDDKTRALFDDGWKIVGAQLSPEALQRARTTLDAALVRVSFDAGVMPGPKKFTWEEGEASWFLQFGDDSAEASFIRRLTVRTPGDATSADTFEDAPAVFLPERIAVEVRLRAPLPVKEFPVRLATRANPDAPVPITARLTGTPGVYRTDFFDIGPSAHGPIAVVSGDRLLATVQEGDLAFIAPPLAATDVRLTPDELASSRTPGDSTQVRLWKDALAFAARADGKTLNDFSTIAGQSLDAYHGIKMTVGDHAAMLLMRAAFLDMMRERLTWLDGIKSDDQVDAFREWIKPFMDVGTPPPPAEDLPVGWDRYPWFPAKAIDDMRKLKDWFVGLPVAGARIAIKAGLAALDGRPESGFGQGTYFGELQVPGPGGGTWAYFRTYWDDRDTAFEPFFHGSRIELRDWRLKATRAVLDQYRAAVQASIDEVSKIHDDDRKELLKLTSIGFAPVVAQLAPTLMRLDDSGGRQQWVPDREARAAVTNLYVYGEAVRKAEDYSNLLRSSAIEVFAAALAWNAPGLVLEEGTAASLTACAGHGLLAWQVGGEIYDHVAVKSEMDTFFGTSVVLGADRLEDAHARSSSIGAIVEDLALMWGIPRIEGEMWTGLDRVTA